VRITTRVAVLSMPIYVCGLFSAVSPVAEAATTPSPYCAQLLATNQLTESFPDPEDNAVEVKKQALVYVAEHAKAAKLAPASLKADYKITSAYWAFQKATWLKVDPKKAGALDLAARKLAAYKGLKSYEAAGSRVNAAIVKICNFPEDNS
jgi:hypothetical protein